MIYWVFSVLLLTDVLAQDRYEAQIPLKGISSQEGFKQALTQVLAKLSGRRPSHIQPPNLREVELLIKDYRYQVEPQQRILIVHFSPPKVDELLNKLGLPHWSDPPPPLLGWILLEDDNTVITEERFAQLTQLLKNQTQARGLTLLFPFMDLEDLRTFTPSQIKENRKAPVTKIAQRYCVNTMLVGWLLKTPEGWQGRWRLYMGEEEFSFNNHQTQLNPLLVEALETSIDEIAKRKTVVPPQQPSEIEEVEVLVTELSALEDYAKVADYFKKLPIVIDLQVLQIQPHQAKFRLTVEGGRVTLLQSIQLGTWLAVQNEKPLTFRLLNR